MRTPDFIQLDALDDRAQAEEAIAGLSAPRAQIAPKFFYDRLGSRLYEAITETPEYYPTRTEAAIFAAHGPAIAQAALAESGTAPTLVDLGAGNCAKAASLFGLLRPARYLALDISADFLREALERLQQRHPDLALTGVGTDFSRRLALPTALLDGPALMFYPGSSIGNFLPEAALRLLREARAAAGGGALLIGADLIKPTAVLDAAYDDALGVTAAFNLNLLRHLNQLIDTDFSVRQWRHVAFYDPAAARIEMHLEAREPLTVRWPGGERRFAAGERIHTEYSCKWSVPDFAALLRQAGFSRVRHWTDPQEWFGVFLAAG
jgi:dimethylhistidine N-methyltransferase